MNNLIQPKNIFICSCARNISNFKESIEKNMITLLNILNNYKLHFVIVESDSNDDSLVFLNSLTDKFNLNLITLGNLKTKIPSRTQRIAICRNQ